jgi:DNA-binding response OmpR family regulator
MDKKRILIVDDEHTFTRMVRLNLEKTGRFEVREENVATRALSTAREFKPDLVLLDVLMPSLDGGDVAAQLRRNHALKNVPIIFLTATVSAHETEKQGLSSGGSLFLGKPVSAERLVEVIDRYLPPPPPAPPAEPPAPQ